MRGCRGLTGVGLSSGRRCIVGRVCARLVLSVQVLVPSRCPRRESNSHGVAPGGFCVHFHLLAIANHPQPDACISRGSTTSADWHVLDGSSWSSALRAVVRFYTPTVTHQN